MLAWRIVLAVRLPVVDVLGWQYHLVAVDVWLQANALVRVTQNAWTDGWPMGGELLTTWLAAFTRNDGLTGFTALLPIPMAMVATCGLARAFGVGRRLALLTGLLFGMIPAVIALAGTTYPDTVSTASVIAAWWLGLRVLRGERDPGALLLFGIAAGLAFGTKGTSILLVSPILVATSLAIVLDLARRLRGRSGVSNAVVGLALLVVPVLVLGASWYLKNLVVHGNPLFPVAFGPFVGPVQAGGFGAPPVPAALVDRSPIEQTLRSWVADWNLIRYSYNQRPGGFGRAWVAVLPFAVAGVVALVRRRDLAAVGLVIAPAVITLSLMTSPWYARYTLYVPGVALPLAALAVGLLRPRVRMVISLALVALASVSLAYANTAPNITIPLPHGRVSSVTGYASFVLGKPDAVRSNVDLRATCAGFGDIPAGDRVAVAESFMIPHAVVGPNLDRILTAPMPDAPGAETLVGAMGQRDAQWLVTRNPSPADELAAADPVHFAPFGRICSRGNLWRFVPPGDPPGDP